MATDPWARFRESRLYAQVVVSLVLVGLVWVVTVLPPGPTARVRGALLWTARTDYDFAGKANRASAWAARQGGWAKAASGLWMDGLERFRTWAKLPPAAAAAPAPAPAPVTAPAPDRLAMPVNGTVLYGFGWLPQAISREFHNGLDLAAPVGSEVTAAGDGKVLRTFKDPKLGGAVEVDHSGLLAIYAQVEHIQVHPGDRVHKGQLLAVVARVAGLEQNLPSHLHFEIRPGAGRAQVDPSQYLGLGGSKP
ncbi:MAG TPA: M23 family metallopeptidase [Symbiobacteriaceae bacterium]|jgi:murein DD-endopeptidase MepM/ murein hydrolase activator NlpD